MKKLFVLLALTAGLSACDRMMTIGNDSYKVDEENAVASSVDPDVSESHSQDQDQNQNTTQSGG
jgi:hypothetical protein